MDASTALVLIVIAIAVVSAGIGFALGRLGRTSRRAHELAETLEATQQELADYRGEVVKQFADTATKFRRLNDSYSDLHQQLATSATVLCADAAEDVLLALPSDESRGTLEGAGGTAGNEATAIDGEAVRSDVEGSEADLKQNAGEAEGVVADVQIDVDEDVLDDISAMQAESQPETQARS